MRTFKALVREPLLQFLALGGLLFGYYEWKGDGHGPGSTRITITPGLVEHLASGFARTWQRPPSDEELKGLVDEHVKEEIATREAVAMGLDKDDAIVRRRLRQKLEFLVEDVVDQVPPTDAELHAWMDRHPDAFRAESRVGLRQVFLSTERRGTSARSDAEKLLARLRAAGPKAKTDAAGDASMLPAELPLDRLSEVGRAFGAEFAAKVDGLVPGQWTGPVESPYGLHLVLVTERAAATRPALDDVRPAVERELQSERRRGQLEALYEKLLQKYTVQIEMPKAAATPPSGAKKAGDR
jgi:parvulin-like peptidyl-prolyl isomerase